MPQGDGGGVCIMNLITRGTQYIFGSLSPTIFSPVFVNTDTDRSSCELFDGITAVEKFDLELSSSLHYITLHYIISLP